LTFHFSIISKVDYFYFVNSLKLVTHFILLTLLQSTLKSSSKKAKKQRVVLLEDLSLYRKITFIDFFSSDSYKFANGMKAKVF